jgi:O-antigen ligase
VLAVALFAGVAVRPARLPLAAAGLLVAFGLWTLISIAWSPLPSYARDDALLCLLYAMAFLTPLLTLRSQVERLLAAVVAVVAFGLLCVFTAVEVHGTSVANVYAEGRLDFAVSYWNGAAALALLGVWPAVALSADRRLGIALRASSLSAATAMVAVWLMTQSKGGAVALAVSGVVFLAVSRDRLRALVPAGIVAVLAALGTQAFTQPYRVAGAAEAPAVHHAGDVALLLIGAAAACGIVYAVLDRRIAAPRSVTRTVSRTLALLLAVGALAGVIGFFADVGHPIGFVKSRLSSFEHPPETDTASSHFTSFGSSRYDFYRVAIREWEKHPLFGLGGHGWPAAYAQYGRSTENPERGHSVELDALSETGLVGFLLLVGAGGAGLAAVSRRMGPSLLPAGLLASGAYFTAHSAIDWVWSIPPVGVFALLLAGIGASRGGWPTLRPRFGIAAGAAILVVAALGFAPPWLSARFDDQASGEKGSAQASDLRWARRLDPLSADPYYTGADLAGWPGDIRWYRRAVSQQPGDAEVHQLLGQAYLDAHRFGPARVQLEIAARLSPRDPGIQAALERARRG